MNRLPAGSTPFPTRRSSDLLGGGIRHLVKELVQGNELRPLDVPVRLLCLQHEVDAVGEAGVQQRRHFGAGRLGEVVLGIDRKSTRLNSSHTVISYAVFCLKK